MKTLSTFVAVCLVASAAAGAQATAPGQHRVLTRVSHQTGVPVHTLKREKAKTGLGFGGLEKANLIAKASGHTFRQVFSRFKSGEGWGQIAHDAGLKLGKLVSQAKHSTNAAHHQHNAHVAKAEARRDRNERAEAREDRRGDAGRRDRDERAEARGDRHERADVREDRHERTEARRDRHEMAHARNANGRNSFHRSSAAFQSRGHVGAMNGLGHSDLGHGSFGLGSHGGMRAMGGHGHGGR